jgi:thioredoxin 1
MSAILPVTTTNFQTEVLDFDGVVLVDFYADWCGPCKRLAPELEFLAQQYTSNNQVRIAKLDTEASPELAEKYEITSIPNVIAFKNGQLIKQVIGLRSKEIYQQIIDENITQ